MGRPKINPEEWLKQDDEMLSWLAAYLNRKGGSFSPSSSFYLHPLLLSAVQTLIKGPDGQHEFAKLKAAWRRYKSDKKRGNEVIQVRLKPQVKKQLVALAKKTGVSETVERLIREECQFNRDRKSAIKEAINFEIWHQNQSALAQFDAVRRENHALKSLNSQLEAEISTAYREAGNILFFLAEYEIATGTHAGSDHKLTSNEKIAVSQKRSELLEHFKARIQAKLSLPSVGRDQEP